MSHALPPITSLDAALDGAELIASLPIEKLSASALRPFLSHKFLCHHPRLIQTVTLWKRSFSWMDDMRHEQALATFLDEMALLLDVIPFFERVTVYGELFDMSAISRVLSSDWVGTEYIDMAMICLVDNVRRGAYANVRPGVILTTSDLFTHIHDLTHKIHARVAQIMGHEETRYLLMPALFQRHFIAIAIDKKEEEVLIG